MRTQGTEAESAYASQAASGGDTATSLRGHMIATPRPILCVRKKWRGPGCTRVGRTAEQSHDQAPMTDDASQPTSEAEYGNPHPWRLSRICQPTPRKRKSKEFKTWLRR